MNRNNNMNIVVGINMFISMVSRRRRRSSGSHTIIVSLIVNISISRVRRIRRVIRIGIIIAIVRISIGITMIRLIVSLSLSMYDMSY